VLRSRWTFNSLSGWLRLNPAAAKRQAREPPSRRNKPLPSCGRRTLPSFTHLARALGVVRRRATRWRACARRGSGLTGTHAAPILLVEAVLARRHAPSRKPEPETVRQVRRQASACFEFAGLRRARETDWRNIGAFRCRKAMPHRGLRQTEKKLC